MFLFSDKYRFWLNIFSSSKNFQYFQTLRDSNNFPQNFQTFPQNTNSSRRLLNALRAFLCLSGTMVAYIGISEL